jgi:hypothetical protein
MAKNSGRTIQHIYGEFTVEKPDNSNHRLGNIYLSIIREKWQDNV